MGQCNSLWFIVVLLGFQLQVEGLLSSSDVRKFRQSWRENVPELPKIPNFPASISFEKIKLEPNDTINTEYCMGRPWIKWSQTISGKHTKKPMYTVILLDVSIRSNMTFIHWIKTNVIGTNTNTGDESMEYQPTFAFRTCSNGVTNHDQPCPTEENNKIIFVPGYSHVFAVMILRQESGKICLEEDEKQVGCNGPMLSKRLQTFDWINNFITKYNLILEAGTFFRNPYTKIVDRLICRLTSCTIKELGTTFPDHIVKGVNDLPECAPFKGKPTAEVDWLALLDKSGGSCIEHGVQMVWKNGYLDQFDTNMTPEEFRESVMRGVNVLPGQIISAMDGVLS